MGGWGEGLPKLDAGNYDLSFKEGEVGLAKLRGWKRNVLIPRTYLIILKLIQKQILNPMASPLDHYR